MYKQILRAKAFAQRTAGAARSRFQVMAKSEHRSGPRKITLDADEVALVCMLKNGTYYLDELIAHHRCIGITKFLFIDNGSQDATVSKLASYPDVTVISNELPVARYESLLRSQIARSVIKGGWFLFVDSDELIEMIRGEGRSIREYARYCNERGYDAVVGQCLDLFSARPLSETEKWSYPRSIAEFNLFSLSSIENFSYHDERVEFSWFLGFNKASNSDILMKFGGVRKELFDENCCLTNHRMVKNTPRIGLYVHPHCSTHIHCADFTLLLRHYKFAGRYLDREKMQIQRKIWDHADDRRRLSVIKDPAFAFAPQQAQELTSTDLLVDLGFLTCSQDFSSQFPPARHKDSLLTA